MKIVFKEPLKSAEPGQRIELKKNKSGEWDVVQKGEILESGPHRELAKLKRDHYMGTLSEDQCSADAILYAHIHCHSDSSLLDGMAKVPDIVAKMEYAGALTDHGNMFGMYEFYTKMLEAGKKPILGFEAYTCDLAGNLENRHLILLAKNDVGVKNLFKLVSESQDNFYRHPHVTFDLLQKYHEGVIATAACVGGAIQQYVLENKEDLAEETIKKYIRIFGKEDFYLEVQRHGLTEETVVEGFFIEMAEKYGLKIIATTDSHYLEKDDAYAHEVLLCMQQEKKMTGPHWKFNGTGYHLHTSEEMEVLFSDHLEWLDNTLDLADKCDAHLTLGEINLPEYKIPPEYSTPMEYFKALCEQGFQKRFAGTTHMTEEKYRERFNYEMDMIEEMGFASYFLIVWDYINFAREHDIYVGPGRGSAAGSLLAYCVGITDLDPIKYDLLFERFLNPERVTMPDIDTDFEHTKRQQVLDYIADKYGHENTCHIVTFGTLGAKTALRDTAKALDYPVSLGMKLSKMVPSGVDMTLKMAMELNPELEAAYKTDRDVKAIMDVAMRLEGCKRHSSQHACGYCVAPSNVSNFFPTSMEKDDEGNKDVTSQAVMTEVEPLGILKMDLLGLKNMTAIHDTLNAIKRTRGIDMDYHDIPLNDRETYRMLRDGFTGGVFQLESPGMTNVVRQMLANIDDLPDDRLDECFERMIAAVALYRPGPMDYIPDYIEGMNNAAAVHYDCPEEEDILKPTYGVLVYQEQLMQLAQKLAGYTLGRADVIRKGAAKKKKDVLAKEKAVFISGNKGAFESGKDKNFAPGCEGNGISKHVAEEIWNKMEKFGAYAFNRSHAACYAYVAVLTAYMACHWTSEFYAAMLNAYISDNDKQRAYLSEAVKRGIKILPPDLNESDCGFVAVSHDAIRFGFQGIKGVNKAAASIVAERNAHGRYATAQEFYERMGNFGKTPQKKLIEGLIGAGAFSFYSPNKKAILKQLEKVADNFAYEKKTKIEGQFTLFDDDPLVFPLPDNMETSLEESIQMERKYTGFYISAHPVDILYPILKKDRQFVPIEELPERDGLWSTTVGLIAEEPEKRYTKNGDPMYRFILEDQYHSVRCTVFPKNVAANVNYLKEGAVVKVIGRFESSEDFGDQFIVRDMLSKDEVIAQSRPTSVCVSINSEEEQKTLLAYVADNPGDVAVIIASKGKLYKKRSLSMKLGQKQLDFLQSTFSKVE